MTRRAHILLSLFGILSLVALLFGLAYNGFMGARLQSYVLQIRRCPYLSETLCEQHPRCQAYFEMGASKVPEFRECRDLPREVQDDSPAARVCGQTGGEWRREKFGPYCNCAVAGKTWTVDNGCQ